MDREEALMSKVPDWFRTLYMGYLDEQGDETMDELVIRLARLAVSNLPANVACMVDRGELDSRYQDIFKIALDEAGARKEVVGSKTLLNTLYDVVMKALAGHSTIASCSGAVSEDIRKAIKEVLESAGSECELGLGGESYTYYALVGEFLEDLWKLLEPELPATLVSGQKRDIKQALDEALSELLDSAEWGEAGEGEELGREIWEWMEKRLTGSQIFEQPGVKAIISDCLRSAVEDCLASEESPEEHEARMIQEAKKQVEAAGTRKPRFDMTKPPKEITPELMELIEHQRELCGGSLPKRPLAGWNYGEAMQLIGPYRKDPSDVRGVVPDKDPHGWRWNRTCQLLAILMCGSGKPVDSGLAVEMAAKGALHIYEALDRLELLVAREASR
jgi:hypothetical protein